ncbi:MAG TPA: hypothetical protein VIL07_04285 [Symbiobacteriaceae bacterium]
MRPYIEVEVSERMYRLFEKDARTKVLTEGWLDRQPVKTANFSRSWLAEEGFQKVLQEKRVRFQYRGEYVGDRDSAGPEFMLWRPDGTLVTLDVRSRREADLQKWQEVPYPDDRFRKEQHLIADYTVACGVIDSPGVKKIRYYGAISKEQLLKELRRSRVLVSPQQGELFRVVSLDCFSLPLLEKLLSEVQQV